jgi:hypothetical protein
MPTTPSTNAIAPAMASITSVNEVRAIDCLQLFRLRKPRLDAAQRLECANHQPRAHQQHQRQCHLGHDQDVACPMSFPALARRAVPSAKTHGEPRPGVLQRRYQPEHEAGEQRNSQGETKRPRVDGDFAQSWQTRRTHGYQEAQPGIGEAQSEHATRRRRCSPGTRRTETIGLNRRRRGPYRRMLLFIQTEKNGQGNGDQTPDE